MRKSFNSLALLALTGAAMMSSCSKDTDLYDSNLAQKQYEQAWTEKFGQVASDQDWNLATQVTANIDLSAFDGASKVEIYNMMPASGGVLIGRATSSTTLKMDVLKSAKYLYVIASDKSDNEIASNYYAIEDGIVNIGATTKATRATRSASDVQIVATTDLRNTTRSTTVDETYTWEEAKKIGDEYYWNVYKQDGPDEYGNATYYLENIKGEKKTETNYTIGNYKSYGAYTNACTSLSPYRPQYGTQGIYVDLSGVETETGSSWSGADLYDLFGKGGYYEEQRTPSCLEKYRSSFSPDITYTVSGEVTLDYIYGATQRNNVFGYYYWQEGDDPIQAKRYILMPDATPSANVTKSGTVVYDSGSTTEYSGALGMMEGASLLVGNTKSSLSNLIFTGTKYKVPYFDENGQATYKFPSNTHIAFFLVVDKKDQAKSNYVGNVNLSVQSHNYKIGRTFTGYSRDNTDGDATKGEIDAISFKYNNKTFLSFEDRGADKDMNDIVFLTTGITPDKTIIPDPIPTPKTESSSWIIACEDLGDDDDYDFNDVVVKVSYVAGENTLSVTPLAAGGVLKSVISFPSSSLGWKGGEIHELIDPSLAGTADGSYPMLNTTGSGNTVDTSTLTFGKEILLGVTSDGFTLSNSQGADNMGGFQILVSDKNGARTIKAPTKGSIPQMFVVPGTWAWPTERTDITIAYPKFKTWTTNTTAWDWFE